jgi:hypothetical protein
MSRYQRHGTDLDLAEGVQKVAQLVWDTDTLSWVRWDGTGSAPGATDTSPKTQRYDFASSTIIYVGSAAIGSSAGSSVWRIKRVTLNGDGNPTAIEYAGSGAFNQNWNDRASLSYA